MARSSRSSRPFGPTTVAFACPSGQLSLAKGPPVGRGAQASDGALLELSGGAWLINPGSVGQPRDGDPRAAWLELDTEARNARFHRVPYEIERAAAPIAAAGLPNRLADRLYSGQ